MLLRRTTGLAIGFVAAWMLWAGITEILQLAGAGNGFLLAMMDPPTGFLRIMAASLVLAGGLLAVLGLPFGAVSSGFGAILTFLLTAFLALAGVDQALWLDEALLTVIFALLVSGLVFLERA